ncbi:MAG: hypothetical protein LBF69_04460 [Prevotellaceae bacterium]|jgi:tetratricopeptide (TPR) repeat protein|nr:hypothetical protein [Prevotellaceae bacterium]
MEPHQFLQYLSATTFSSAGEVQQLEQFANQYPWCGIAHQLLLEAYHLNNNEKEAGDYAPMAAIYAITRHYLYQRLQQIKSQKNALPVNYPEKKTTGPPELKTPAPIRKEPATVPSGEYFSSDDLSLINPGDDVIGRFITEKPKISPLSSSLMGVENTFFPAQTVSYAPEDMVTETLAKIYADQGLYTRAIDVYEKLSLREPKKSAYFALLIQNLKNLKSKC